MLFVFITFALFVFTPVALQQRERSRPPLLPPTHARHHVSHPALLHRQPQLPVHAGIGACASRWYPAFHVLGKQ